MLEHALRDSGWSFTSAFRRARSGCQQTTYLEGRRLYGGSLVRESSRDVNP